MARSRKQYRSRSRSLTSLVVRVSLLPVVVHHPAFAQSALPQAGTVASGQASISSSANALTVQQSSNRAVINWGSFSIGAGNSVNFVQPSASSATLNRVTGSTTSNIAGQLTSNGQVFLVNPNGIFITPTGSVQTGGGFIASTLDIANADFNGGYYKFTGNGASATVSNAGSISSGPGTYVALLGGTVSSSGTINAYLGRVGLASGEQVILNPSGDGFLQVAVPTSAMAPDGRALVDVAGRIKAAGGKIQVSAASAQDASRDVINISGTLSARTVSGSRGNITLGGGEGGNVTVTGRLSATGGKTEKGGTVEITGSTVNLRGALINASGGTGGGTVNVGGGWQGTGPLQRATTTNVDSGTTLRADATVSGNGGVVTVWADGTTTFGGFISAQGGPGGGNGGQAEVSGKTHLTLNGDYTRLPLANLKAPLGETGNLLFDPGTVHIVDQASLNNNTALNGPDTFTAQFISSQLGSANVTIATNNATGANGAAGDINLLSNAQIAWSSNSRLTLNAARDINFAAGSSITGTGGSASLVLQAGSDGAGIGTVRFNGGTQVSLPSGSVDLYYNPASNRTVANGGSNNSAGTVNGTSYTGTPAAENWASFISTATRRAWMLVNNVFDLQNVANALNGRFAQGKDIDASTTSGWNSGAGFVPLGTDGVATIQNAGNGFAGTFDGQSKSITGLVINRPTAVYTGLFGYIGAAGSVTNTIVANANITGKGTGPCCEGGVGALAGENTGSISNSSASGSLTGEWNVGGLVGENTGSIDQSSSSVTVNAIGSFATGGLVGWNTGLGVVRSSYATGAVVSVANYVGGLVGTNDASIADSYATGSVSGGDQVGGLVGWNSTGSITRAYATGAVSGNNQVGGLVGWNTVGSISETYATGAVTGSAQLGGLAGANAGTIASSFFDTTTTGQASAVGVDTGSTTATGLTTGQAFTQASYTGWDFTNTWWMQDGQTRPFLRSEYSTTITSSHQLQLINMSSATLGAAYTLRGSIDLAETSGGGASMWTASGFVPLGTDGAGNRTNSNNGFTGTFDGAGYTVDALNINRAVNYVGLFGAMGPGGVIQNVGVTNVNITGSSNVGALVGHSYGTVSNAFSTGTVSIVGGPNAGGLVGGQINGVIERSYSSASVSGAGSAGMGGLLGTNNAGTVRGSYATGSVNNSGAASSGGLVGANINGGIIDRTYATGSVTSSATNTGGLVGSSNGNITESYAVGAVSGTSNVGGLIGLVSGGTNASSYFDNQTTGQISGVGSGSSVGVTGLNTATFQNGSLPSGFNPMIWIAQAGQYPQLSLPGVVKITVTDSGAGNVTYGSTPSFSYTVTDANGTTICTTDCSAFFSGTPLIDSTIKSTTNAGTSAPGYIAKGTLSAVSGYVIQFINDTITVVAKALTITASDQSKTYGQTATLGNSAFTTAGLTNGDTVSAVTLNSAGAVNTAGVAGSPYSIIPSNAVGTGLSNYTVSYVNGQLTVDPAPITVTALSGSSTYGSSPANPGLSATGLQNGQTVAVLTGLSNSFGITNNTNAGSYTMNVAGILTNANYTVTGTNTGTWDVNPAPVTVTARGGTSTYGSSPANPGLSATGLQNGQSAAVLTGLSNTFGITNNTDAGSYTMNVAGVNTNGNYTVTGTNTGTWNVNPASVTVTALGGSSTYGSSPANPGLTATGLQNGQTVAALTGLSNSFGITNTTNAGTYTMNVAGVLTNPNYTVAGTNTNPWTVNPALITVTALGGNSSYGMSPANPGLSATGLQNGETPAVLTGLSNSFGITSMTVPGSYAMNVAGVLTNGNYTVTRTYSQPWTVFPAGQAVPPYVPPPPPSDTTGSISGLPSFGLDVAARGGASSSLDGGGGLRLGTPSMTRPGGYSAASPVISEGSGTSFAQDYALRVPAPEPSRPAMSAAAGDDKTDDCDPTVTMSAKQRRGAGGGSGCAAKLAGKLDGAIDFTLNALTRNAVIDSIETAFTEMISAKSSKLTIAKNVTAGTTLVVTAGIIGWLLRGGALLSALLSSMPLWRTFDPMVVVSRRREDGAPEDSEVDRIFDMAGAAEGAKA